MAAFPPARDVLPNSVPRETKGRKTIGGWIWIPIFCANCGRDGGMIPEDQKDFAFYLCEPCAVTWGQVAGTMLVPDEVFWERVKQAQLEHDGRELAASEVGEALKDDEHYLSKLAKDRPRRTLP
jgi:hypothetical protein